MIGRARALALLRVLLAVGSVALAIAASVSAESKEWLWTSERAQAEVWVFPPRALERQLSLYDEHISDVSCSGVAPRRVRDGRAYYERFSCAITVTTYGRPKVVRCRHAFVVHVRGPDTYRVAGIGNSSRRFAGC